MGCPDCKEATSGECYNHEDGRLQDEASAARRANNVHPHLLDPMDFCRACKGLEPNCEICRGTLSKFLVFPAR